MPTIWLSSFHNHMRQPHKKMLWCVFSRELPADKELQVYIPIKVPLSCANGGGSLFMY